MTYATQADLETRYGALEVLQLADRDGSGAVDSGVVAAAITAAEVEIDGYLAVKYALPLTLIPPLVTLLCCEIARYRLWSTAPSELVRNGYEDAVAQLKRLASGAMRLIDVAGSEPVGGLNGNLAEIVVPPRVFGRDASGGLA